MLLFIRLRIANLKSAYIPSQGKKRNVRTHVS